MLKQQTTEEPTFASHSLSVPSQLSEVNPQVRTAGESHNLATQQSVAQTYAVDHLLDTLKQQVRLQKAFRWGAIALAIPPVLLVVGSALLKINNAAGMTLIRLVNLLSPFEHRSASSTILPNGTTETITVVQHDLITPVILTLGCVLLGALWQRQKGKITRVLAAHDDLRAVGPLAQALEIGNKTVAAQAAAALVRLLPRLRSADAVLLDNKQRACLHRALGGPNTLLTLAILSALEQVGNEHDLKAVEQFISSRPGKSSDEAIQKAAQGVLHALRRHFRQERDTQTLLRGSERSVESDSRQLLRGIQPDGLR